MSKATSGIGTLFQRGNGASPEVFTTLAEVLSITGPDEELETHDVTNMSSPTATGYTGIYREFIGTLLKGGTVSFDLNYLPNDTTQNALHTDMLDVVRRDFQIVLPNDPLSSPLGSFGTLSFTGFVTKMGKEFPIDKQMTIKVTIQITGPVNYTAGV